MSKIKFLTALFSTVVISATAQEDTSQNKSLEEVIVTANKYPQKQTTTGKVITVITKEQIERSEAKTVAQLLNEQAGITINGALNAPGNVQTIYMRGASQGRTLILVDGIPVNDPSAINNEFDMNLLALNDIERIEVCRGAHSTLYGSDAIAGVINIITVKQGVQRPLHVKSGIAGGNLSSFRGNTQIYGKKNKFSYTARYAKLITNSFSNAHDTIRSEKFDNDGYDGNVVNTQLVYQPSSQLSFKTFGMYSQYQADIDAAKFTDDRDYTATSKYFMGGAGFRFKSGFVSVTGNYQYSDIRRQYLNDSMHTPETAFSRYEDNRYYGKNQFAEIFSTADLGKGFTLLHGADYRYSSYNQTYFSISDFGPFSSLTKDTSLSQTSIYSSLNFSGIQNKLNIELGGRLNTHSRYGSNYTYTFNPSYQLNTSFRIFGSVASGFKAPTLYQLSTNVDLKAENSVNYEIGTQIQYNIVNSRMVLFYREMENGLDYNYITFKYFNYIKQVVKGVEFEMTIKPIDKINISTNYTYLSTRETNQNRVTAKDTITYSYLIRRPNHAINIHFGIQANKQLYFSLTGKYNSKRYDVGGYQKDDILLKEYFIANIYAEYQYRDWLKFFADVQNVFNKKFFDIYGFNSVPLQFTSGISVSL